MYRYEYGLKLPKASGSLIRGKAIDETANDHFVKKADQYSDAFDKGLNNNDFIDLAVSNHDRIAEELPPENWQTEVDESRDKTSKFADLYHGTHGKKLKARDTESVQMEIRSDIGIGKDILGYIDLITDKNVVVDNKVKKRNTYGNLARDLQLVLYSMVTKIPRVAIALIQDIKVPKSVYRSQKIPQASYTAVNQKINDVVNGINSGVFLPAPEGSWLCSSNWCEFWNICDFGEKAGRDKWN